MNASMKQTRWAIVILGILSPYLARIPGVFTHGMSWLTSYTDVGITGFLFFAAFNSICWGVALLSTLAYKNPSSAWFPALFALVSNFWLHSTVDLASDAQAALALLVIPFMTLPFTATGWILGWMYDRRNVSG